MPTLANNSCHQNCVIDLPSVCAQDGRTMEEYLSSPRSAGRDHRAGKPRGNNRPGSHDWMLAQVDFIVESAGKRTMEMDDEMRSSLLQLFWQSPI